MRTSAPLVDWRAGRVAALLLTLALVIAGCGGSDQPDADSGGETAAGGGAGDPAELVMWNIPLSDAYTTFWEDYVAEFNATHPDIHVTHEVFDTEVLKTRIRASLLAGTEPDIWFFYPGEFTTLNHRSGKVRALDDILPVSDYTAESVERCTDGDAVICMPLFLAPSAVYYNTAHFADAGVDPGTWADPQQPTLDEFYAAMDDLKAAGITPLAMGNSESWPFMHLYWAAQNRYGGTEALNNAVLGENGGTYQDESFVRAGTFVQDLVDRDVFPSGFNGVGGDEKYAQFHQGDAAMIYQGPWMISIAESNAPGGFDYDMFHFPSFEDGNPDSQRDVMAGLDALFVSSSTEHPEAVGEFLSGFSEPETATRFMVETDNISPVEGIAEGVFESGDAGDKLLRLTEMMAEADHTFQWWDWLLPPAVAEAMLDVSQPLALGEMTPEDAAAALEEAAQR